MEKPFSNLRGLVEFCAEKFSSKTAFKIKNKDNGKVSYRDVSFNDVKEETKALGKYFLSQSEKEQRIVVIGKNSYEWMLVFLSALSSGNVIVPLDNSLPANELENQLSRAEADFVFYSSQHESFFSTRPEKSFCTESPEFEKLISEGKSLDDAKYNNVKIDSDKMSLLLFTSGTSADSKAVMLS